MTLHIPGFLISVILSLIFSGNNLFGNSGAIGDKINDFVFDYYYSVYNYVPRDELILIEKNAESAPAALKSKNYISLALSNFYYSIDKAKLYAGKALESSQKSGSSQDMEAALTHMIFFNLHIGQYDSAYSYSKEYYRIFGNSLNGLTRAKSLSLNGLIDVAALNYKSAFENYYSALDIYDSLNNNFGLAVSYYNIGRVFSALGNLPDALKYFQRSSAIFRMLNLADELTQGYIMTGIAYRDMKNYQKALKYLHLSLSMRLNRQSVTAEILSLRELGIFYIENEKNTDSAKYYLTRALRLSSENGLLIHTGGIYTLLSHVSYLEGDNKAALDYNLQAYSYRNRYGIKNMAASSLLNIGYSYFLLNDKINALNYYNKGLELSKNINALNYVARGYELLSEYYAAAGNNKEALKSLREYIKVKDSLTKQANDKNLMKLHFEYEMKQQENALNYKREISDIKYNNEKTTGRYLILFIILSCASTIIILFFYLKKRKANQSLEEINTKLTSSEESLKNLIIARDKFFSITSHDLKNPLYYFSLSLNLFSKGFDLYKDDDKTSILKEMAQSADKLYSLLENLILWSEIHTGSIELCREAYNIKVVINSAINDLDNSFNGKGIQIKNNAPDNIDIEGDPALMSIIIRNILSNALKFSHHNGIIEISSADQIDFFELIIKDYGVGMAREELDNLFKIEYRHNKFGTNNERGSGLGLIISKELIEFQGGSIWVESEENVGTTFSILIPYKEFVK